MAREDELLEARLENLTQRLEELSSRVDHLYSYLRIPPRNTGRLGSQPSASSGSTEEQIIWWAHKTSLLPGLSTICFILVIALVLRTLTDNHVLDTNLGSLTGIGYAAALMFTGYWRYGKADRLAGVFSICGVLLLCSIVLESHRRFHSLESSLAYCVLLAAGLVSFATGLRFQRGLPAAIGLISVCTASIALEHPNQFFPPLAGILFIANTLGYILRRLQGSSWVRWPLMFITLAFMTFWSGRLTIALGRNDQELLSFLALPWFLVLVGSFCFLYPLLCLLGMLHGQPKKTSWLESAVPGLTGLWAFGIAYQVLESWAPSVGVALLGLAGALLGAAQLLAAHMLGCRAPKHRGGINSFALGACLLMVLSLPALTGSGLVALVFVSGMAWGLFLLSELWESAGVRIMSYLLQLYAGSGVGLLLWSSSHPAHVVAQALPGAFVSFLGIVHYLWCLRRPPLHVSSNFFSRYDKKHNSAILPLAGSFLSGFFVLRLLIEETLHLAPGDFSNSFGCAQSILINFSAAVLMLYAYLRADQRSRNLAILLTMVGAVKVFMFDLLQARGIPLVLSVFSFGLAALLESILLGRWQKMTQVKGKNPPSGTVHQDLLG
ncbi:MAG: hypothetical protein WHX93_05045 [bacterium]